MENKPSDKQIALLAKWGKFTPGMTKEDAHKIISERFGTPTDITPQYEAPKQTSVAMDKDRSIVRQCCLKAASVLNQNNEEWTVDSVLHEAEMFEAWVYR